MLPIAWLLKCDSRNANMMSPQASRTCRRPMPRSDLTRPAERTCSIQRLELDDRGAVVGADPERHRIGRIVDEYAADIGRARQQIFDELAGPGVQAHDLVGAHRAGPRFLVLVEHDV